jgi:hypothetical protein
MVHPSLSVAGAEMQVAIQIRPIAASKIGQLVGARGIAPDHRVLPGDPFGSEHHPIRRRPANGAEVFKGNPVSRREFQPRRMVIHD